MKKGGALSHSVMGLTFHRLRKYGLVFIMCVCVFITHRSFTEESHVILLPPHFLVGVLTEKMVWLVCWWK